MEDLKKQIIDWFKRGQDFDKGVSLLKKASKKDKLVEKILYRGDMKWTYEKLVWELNKIAGLARIPERKFSRAKKKNQAGKNSSPRQAKPAGKPVSQKKPSNPKSSQKKPATGK